MNKPFLTDIKTLRARARQHIEQGAVTEGYRADRETILKILNEALATDDPHPCGSSEYVEGDSLVGMIEEDLVAERIAIDSYREMVNYIGEDDPTTRRLMEEILAKEEEHAEDLVSLLQGIGH